jgi:hypothetical protein
MAAQGNIIFSSVTKGDGVMCFLCGEEVETRRKCWHQVTAHKVKGRTICCPCSRESRKVVIAQRMMQLEREYKTVHAAYTAGDVEKLLLREALREAAGLRPGQPLALEAGESWREHLAKQEELKQRRKIVKLNKK